jgi:long-chain fatty acid transport protein
MKFKNLLLLTSSSLLVTKAYAGAYMFPELGMMSISTAGAGAQAVAEGAETAFANPAAMTELSSTTVAFNLQGMVSNINYTDSGSTGLFAGGDSSTKAGTAMPVASFYVVTPLSDKWSAGLAFASAGGSIIDYGPQFSGSLLLQDAQLTTVQLNPSIAYQVKDNWSLGLGLVAEYGLLEQNFAGHEESLLPPLTAEGSSVEFGYTLSSLYKFNHNNRIGFTYRSELNHAMDGDISTSNNDSTSSVNIIMPATAIISGYHQLNSKPALLWSLGWSDFSEVSETAIALPNREAGIAREWQDTFSASVGMHYPLNQQWRLESGVYYETSPQDDPSLQYPDVPTGELWKLGLGASYEINPNWRMQMYYEYYYGGTPSIDYTLFEGSAAESTLKGDYEAAVHFFGVLFNYQF